MRYEDSSGAFQASGPIANDDADTLSAGERGPATGNLITGEGTQYGSAGADSAVGAQITAIAGKGGEDTSFSGGKLSVDGEHGRLSVDADGNYSYLANSGVENVRDRFTYTLADNQGNSDTAALIIEIGKTPAVIKADAQQIVPGPDGVVTLPPGVELSDIRVVGRNLVVDLPDGTQLIIIDGAIFVPQLVLGGVEVPATNVAALLIGQEVQPAAGELPPSSGGNFALPPPPLDPGIPLGDLIPPTELNYIPPEPQEVLDVLDREPEAGAVAVQLDDDARPGGIAGGIGDDPDSVNATGFLPGSGGDGALTWSLLLTGAPAGFTYVDGPGESILVQQGGVTVLTITVNPATGEYSVVQNAAIDHAAGGDENNVEFVINYTVTDQDGDVAIGTLTVNVDDDTPTVDATVSSDANVLLTTQDADTIGAATDTASTSADFGGIFGASGAFGADGPGTASVSYALSTAGGASGLTHHGDPINLYLIGGVVVGSTAASAGAVNASNTIFDISVNNVGVVTVNQYSQIDHTNTDPSPTGPAYDDHLISMADGAVTLTLTASVTDGDGDSVTDTASVGIGANIRFADDGPTIDPTLNEASAAIVDESEPVEAATIPLVGGFTAGDDPHLEGGLAIGKGSTGGPVIDANAAFGADGPADGGGISYALEVLNAVSGLTTTEGTAINLVELSNGVVVGVVDGTTTVAFAISIDSTTGVVTVEQYLSLFHPDSPDNFDEPVFLNEGSLGVTVTASDFDGDSVTSDAVDITSLIRFEDDGPSVDPALNANATVTVDESLPSGAPAIDTGGIVKGDDPDLAGGLALGQANSGSAIVNANAVFGADGPAAGGGISYALSITNPDPGVTLTDGTSITMQLVGGVIVGVVDAGPFAGQAAFAIAIDPTTGVVTVEQYLSLDHPVNPDPNDPLGLGENSVAVNVTATDGDGDQITSGDIDISGQITFLDDGPSISPTLNAQATVTVDESLPSTAPAINTGAIVKGDDPDLAGGLALGQGNSGVAIVDANAVFGADGPAAGGGISYALSITNASSGLTLTDGSAINLQLVGGVIVGVVASGPFAGQAAFAIAIDSSTGVVSVEQYLSLDHPVNPDPNDPLGLGDNTIAVTVTATDGDGDPVTSAAVDISDQITFLDDGPSVNPALSTAGPAIVDESEPVAAAAIDTGSIVKGNDPHLAGGLAIGSGSTGGSVIDANAVFGADGPAAANSLVYDLVILNASSGLTTTEGDPINLVELPSGVIVGVVDGGTFDGQAAFAIAINSATGVVTVEQYLSITHPDFPDNFDEPVFLDEGVLGATVTATDGDGDAVTSDAVDIASKIRFEDDGPSAQDEPQQNVPEGNQTVSGTFDFFGGADGGSVTHINDVALVFGVDGWSQWIAVDDGQIRAQADGDYEFQSDASGSGVTSGTYTVTDGDGDQVEADWAFNITDANFPTAGVSNARLDDDGLAGGNPLSTTGDIDANVGEVMPVNPEEDIFHGQLTLSFGGDGPGTVTFAAMHGVMGSVGTETVTYSWNGGTSTLTATVTGGPRDGTPLFDIVVNQTTGEYTLTLRDNVIHSAGGDEASAPNVALTYTVTDSDNSPPGGVNGTLNITFNDDAPTLTNVQPGAGVDVDETDAGSPAGFPISDTSASAVITATQAFGADGAAAVNSVVYGLAITGGPGSGLQTAIGNFAITLVQIDGDTIQGQYQDGGTQVAFTIQMNANGTVTLTQNVPLEHNTDGPSGPAHNDTLNLSGLINATITITDGDGDSTSASAAIGGNLVFFDDGPDAQVDGAATLDQLVLDETRPLGTETDGDSDPAGLATVQANFANNFVGPVDYGADGAGTTTYSLSLSANGIGSGLYALDPTDTETVIDGYGQGAEITLSINPAGTLITGSVGGTNYFTISIDPATGIVTFTQLNNIWHANTADADDTSTLNTAAASNIQVIQRVTDSDGDFDTAAVNIGQGVFHIEDDGPQAIQPDSASLANEPGASVTADLDDDGEVITDFGEDGPGLVRFANITNGQDSGLTSDDDAITYWLSNNGQTLQARTNSTNGADGELVFTVQINQATGDYTVTMTGTIDNGAGVSFDNLTSTKAGNVDVRAVGADDPGTVVDLILTASGPGGVNATINTDSDSIGSANQSMDQGETVRIDFVTNAQANAGLPSGFSYDGHVGTSSVIQTIPQVQGNQAQTVAFQVYALDTSVTDAGSPDDYPGDGFSDSTIVAITHVTIDGFGVGETPVTVAIGPVGVWTTIAYGVSAQLQADGSVIFTGIQEGDQYGFETASDFNAFAVTSLPAGIGPVGGQSTTNSFDLGVFAIGSVDTGDPVNVSYDLSITDADGDTVTMPGAIDITFEPATESLAASSFQSQSFSTTSANDDYSSLYGSNEGFKYGGNAFGNLGNTGITSAMVAASGLAAMSMSSLNSFSQPSYDSLVQDSLQSLSTRMVGREGLDEGLASISFGNQLGGQSVEAVNMSSSGFSFSDHGFGGGSLDAMSSGGAEPAYVPSYASGEPAAFSVPAFAANVPTVSMASAEMLKGGSLDNPVQHGGAIEQVLADALGSGAPTIDGILANLPGAISELAAIANLASPDAAGVPAWDMGMHGGFVPAHDMLMKVAAVEVHQDAVQPA